MQRNLTVEDVERVLRQPLPGVAAQRPMTTRPRVGAEQFQHRYPPRHSAVLVLLYPHRDRLHVPLTRRTERVANHKGQISLPGGALEEADPTLWATALREAGEEIGVAGDQVRRIAELSRVYIPNSNYDVHPFVGYAPARPEFVVDADEVAELLEMPLEMLLDPEIKFEETWTLHGRSVQVPFYRFQGQIIWGATAMILSELEVMLLAGQPGEQGNVD